MNKETQKKYTEHILKFLDERPYISASGVSKKAGINSQTIALAKKGRLIPAYSIFLLLAELSKCGIKDIYGYDLEYDQKTHCLFASKKIKVVRTIEVLHLKNGNDHRREITPEMEEVAVDEDGNIWNPFYDKDPLKEETAGTSYEYEVLEYRTLYSSHSDL